MLLTVQMDYLHTTKSGHIHYRRRVPKDLKAFVGRGDYLQESLRTKDPATALKGYPAAHAAAERILAAAREKSPEARRYEATLKDLKGLGLVDQDEHRMAPVTMDDQERFQRFTGAILAIAEDMTDKQANSRLDPEGRFERLLAAKVKGVEKPKITIREARTYYLNKAATAANLSDLTKQTRLVVERLCEVANEDDPTLAALTVDHAERFQNSYLTDGVSPGTIRRRVTTIKAIINRIILKRPEDLPTAYRNPFNSLTVDDDRLDKEKRGALKVEEIGRVAKRMETMNAEISAIWTLLAYTGAREGEICGLLWSEVDLDHPSPHIHIKPNEIRALKTKGSKRKVPLIGAALATLKGLAEEPRSSDRVFPRYAGKGGSVSALLGKAMKAAGVWEKTVKVPHSLRHSHKDWMRWVAPESWVDCVHGHGSGLVSRDYGEDEFLEKLAGYIETALARAKLGDAFSGATS